MKHATPAKRQHRIHSRTIGHNPLESLRTRTNWPTRRSATTRLHANDTTHARHVPAQRHFTQHKPASSRAKRRKAHYTAHNWYLRPLHTKQPSTMAVQRPDGVSFIQPSVIKVMIPIGNKQPIASLARQWMQQLRVAEWPNDATVHSRSQSGILSHQMADCCPTRFDVA